MASSTASRLKRNESQGLWAVKQVPAERVGALAVEHGPGLDDVALALAHLLALGVEDQAEADDVAVGRSRRTAACSRRAASRTSRASGRAPRR